MLNRIEMVGGLIGCVGRVVLIDGLYRVLVMVVVDMLVIDMMLLVMVLLIGV